MRSPSLPLYLALMAAALLLSVSHAHAQLFSWGHSQTAAPRSAAGPSGAPRAVSAFSRWNPFAFSQRRNYSSERDEERGAYRTLCVRLCDGFYFPISYRTTRSRMYRESKVCEASCDCETRLYYLPSSSSDIANMTDLSGLSYRQLESAFKYRTEVDDSCACRPQPWSVAERMRHGDYAEADSEHKAQIAEARLDSTARETLAAMRKNEPEEPMRPAVVAAEATLGSEHPTSDAPNLSILAMTVTEEPSSAPSPATAAMALLPASSLENAEASQRSRAATRPRPGRSISKAARAQLRTKKPVTRGFFQL